MSAEPRLAIDGLQIRIGGRQVVDLAHLRLGPGEIVGLAGESGSGKSMTAQAVLGLTKTIGAAVAGSVIFDGIELVGLNDSAMRHIRGRRIAMIFQSPVSSLNPVFRVGDVFVRALRLHGTPSKSDAVERAKAALREVLLAPELLERYPSQLSGGQAQRVSIAMALALRSEVLLADEPTSALDVTVQAEILDLLRSLRDETGMSVLFISHDLAVIAELCERVVVMQQGRIVEEGIARDVLTTPTRDYTKELVASVPRIGGGAPA
jgi:ABC-type glutathione transport system ATPase component